MAAAALAIPAAAGSESQELSLANLLDIKLQTGSFLELDLRKSPLSMTVIDRRAVDVSGARNLSELLEIHVPGFQYMYNRWNGLLWGMRGVANDRNTKFIVLVNGHKMNTEARDGFFQETSIGMLGDVERVEVLRGPAGLVYGSGAIAGIVNIVTRDVENPASEMSASARTWEDLGTLYTSAEGRVFARPSEGTSVVASVGWEQSDGVGIGKSRNYGYQSSGYPLGNGVDPRTKGVTLPSSTPVDGSAWQTPGNWKTSLDFRWNELRIYARATHQVQEGGAFWMRDPWPAYNGGPVGLGKDTTAAGKAKLAQLQQAGMLGTVIIDGQPVTITDPFWGSVENGVNARREYVADNVMVDMTWDLPIEEDLAKFRLGFDGNTNRITRQARAGYATPEWLDERDGYLEQSFGERRYTMGASYLLKRIPRLQMAVGGEQSFYDIGDDLEGQNFQKLRTDHKVVSDILYANTGLFTEAWYDILDNLGVDAGVRWDGHTRTIDDGGSFNGKVALVSTPAQGHTFKLIAQTSSNNGSAENYEFNRNHYDDAGNTYTAPHLAYPDDTLSPIILSAATEADLHSLKPERVYSFELTSMHDLPWNISASPSVSYNMVRDLFAWNQTLYRVVNVGQYDHLDIDLQVDWTSKYLDLGANHAIQMVMNTDVESQTDTFVVPEYKKTPGSVWYTVDSSGGRRTYTLVPTGTRKVAVNPVRDQITRDDENFLNLARHSSKIWVNVKPLAWLTVHSDARIFWGLEGRDSTYTADGDLGYNNLDVANAMMVKWNASVQMDLQGGWKIGLFGYDLLGSAQGDLANNAIRWQEMADPGQRDLYAMDLRSFGVKIDKTF